MSDLRCPRCSAKQTSVLVTRVKRGSSIRRRRACKSCGFRYATIEISEEVFKSLISADTLAHQRRTIEKAIATLQPLLASAMSEKTKDTSNNT